MIITQEFNRNNLTITLNKLGAELTFTPSRIYQDQLVNDKRLQIVNIRKYWNKPFIDSGINYVSFDMGIVRAITRFIKEVLPTSIDNIVYLITKKPGHPYMYIAIKEPPYIYIISSRLITDLFLPFGESQSNQTYYRPLIRSNNPHTRYRSYKNPYSNRGGKRWSFKPPRTDKKRKRGNKRKKR